MFAKLFMQEDKNISCLPILQYVNVAENALSQHPANTNVIEMCLVLCQSVFLTTLHRFYYDLMKSFPIYDL